VESVADQVSSGHGLCARLAGDQRRSSGAEFAHVLGSDRRLNGCSLELGLLGFQPLSLSTSLSS
jgi:hypothetical protein